jgi:hypothetical protein
MSTAEELTLMYWRIILNVGLRSLMALDVENRNASLLILTKLFVVTADTIYSCIVSIIY